MKLLLFPGIIACIFSLYFSTSSCTKNVTTTVRDTVTQIVIHNDTTVNRDTVYLNPEYPITGEWIGSYFLSGDAVDSFMYQFSILADGTIYTIGSGTNGGAGYASGPWTLNGTAFSATLTTMADVQPENVQTISATYDSVAGRLYNGTWVDTRGNGGQTGTFTVRRVQ
jgi:hypothetical protein